MNFFKKLSLVPLCLALLGTFSSCKEDKDVHEYVDLGDGILWATCNVGAEHETEYGDYFRFGETSPLTTSNYDNYPYDSKWTYSDYYKAGVIGKDSLLTSKYDPATVNWGSNWRTPSNQELETLSKYESVWEKKGGTWGRTIIGTNGNKLFLPATGHVAGIAVDKSALDYMSVNGRGLYWSSWYAGYGDGAYLTVESKRIRVESDVQPLYARPIRAVKVK